MSILISELPSTILPSRLHELASEKDGLSVKLTVGQILDLLIDETLAGDENFASTIAEALGGKRNLAFSATAKAILGDTDRIEINDGDLKFTTYADLRALLRRTIGPDFLVGLTTTRNSNTRITVAPGAIKGNNRYVENLENIAKDINATWAAGNNAGGMEPTKVGAANTTYHLHALIKTSDLTFDWMYSPDVIPANIPAGYIWVGRFWSTYCVTANVVMSYIQKDNECYAPAQNWYSSSGAFGPILSNINASLPCPAGISVNMRVQQSTASLGAGSVINSAVYDADDPMSSDVSGFIVTPNQVTPAVGVGLLRGRAKTNLNRQLGTAMSLSGTGTITVALGGWEDYTLPRIRS